MSLPQQPKRATLGVVWLTLFLDLVGFSIIFPLFPAILDFYLPVDVENGGLLSVLVDSLRRIAPASYPATPFIITVLFGGILGSLYAFLQFLAAPFWGRLSDRIGRRPVLLLTVCGTAVSYLVWAFSGSSTLLIASRLLGGLMAGNLSVATAAMADLTSRKDRAKGMALIGVAFGLGFITGPAIGGLAAQFNVLDYYPQGAEWGLNPFSVPAFAALLMAFLNLLWVRTSFRETLTAAARGRCSGTDGDSARRPRALFSALFRMPTSSIPRALWINFVFVLAFSGMEFTLTFLAVERLSFTPTQNGFLFVFIGLCLILVQGIVVRRLAPLVGEKRLVIVGALFAVIAFIGTAYADSLLSFLGSQALFATGIGLFNPSLTALVSLYASERTQGHDLGLFRSVGSLARACGPLFAAMLYFSYNSRSYCLIGALIMVAPLILAFRLTSPYSSKEQQQGNGVRCASK